MRFTIGTALLAVFAAAAAGCSSLSPGQIALRVQGRNPALLQWPARGDLLRDSRVLRQGGCCTDGGPHNASILFASHVPGGAVVIEQLVGKNSTQVITDAGQFPLREDGTPELGTGTNLYPPEHPAGLSAVLEIPTPGQPTVFVKPHPFLLLVAAPTTDAVDYALTHSVDEQARDWTSVPITDGWATVTLPPASDHAKVRIRWYRAGQIVQQGLPDTPYVL